MDEPRPWPINVPRPWPMNVPPLWWPRPLVLRLGDRGWERQGERDREWERQSSPFSSLDLWPLWALWLAPHHRFRTSPCSDCNPSKLGCRSSARSKSPRVAHIECRGWLCGSHALEPISAFSALSKGHRHRWSYRPTVQSVFWGEPREMLVRLLVLVLLVQLLVLVPMWWLEREVPLPWMREVLLPRMWEGPLPSMREVPLPRIRRGPIRPPSSEPASVGIPMLWLPAVRVVLLSFLPGWSQPLPPLPSQTSSAPSVGLR